MPVQLKIGLVRSLREATLAIALPLHVPKGLDQLEWRVDDHSWSDDEMLSLFVVTILVTDFGDEALAHQTTGDEPRSVVMHFL